MLCEFVVVLIYIDAVLGSSGYQHQTPSSSQDIALSHDDRAAAAPLRLTPCMDPEK